MAQMVFGQIKVLTDIRQLINILCIIPITSSSPVNFKKIFYTPRVIRLVPATRNVTPICVVSPFPSISPGPSCVWKPDSPEKGLPPFSQVDNKILFLLVCDRSKVPCCYRWFSWCYTLTIHVSLCPSCCLGLKLVTSAVVWIEFPSMNADIFYKKKLVREGLNKTRRRFLGFDGTTQSESSLRVLPE